MNNQKKKVAFTLAEVLIVLTIIGILAALTIPALMQSTQDQELKAAWKKEFSALSQASLQIANENGGDISSLFNGSFSNAYSTYLKTSKNCNSADYSCFIDFNKTKRLNGTNMVPGCWQLGWMIDDGGLI